jgi:hypothetical protein
MNVDAAFGPNPGVSGFGHADVVDLIADTAGGEAVVTSERDLPGVALDPRDMPGWPLAVTLWLSEWKVTHSWLAVNVTLTEALANPSALSVVSEPTEPPSDQLEEYSCWAMKLPWPGCG